MNVATGTPESHPGSGANPYPYDPGQSPATARPTATDGQQTPADQVPAFDGAADQSARLNAYESDMRGAQARGQDARNAMLAHYAQDILPLGAAFGDPVVLPSVPANAVPSEMSDLYPYPGLEPTPATTGFAHPSPLPE